MDPRDLASTRPQRAARHATKGAVQRHVCWSWGCRALSKTDGPSIESCPQTSVVGSGTNPCHADPARLLVMLGMRRGGALALRWTGVDLDAGTVAVLGSLQRVGNQLQRVPTKTRGSLRTIPLPTPCVEALRSHQARQNSDRLAAGARWTSTDWYLPLDTAHRSSRAP